MSRRSRRSRGQALAEFALIVPIFLLIVFAIIDLGRYVFTANALSNSAREAARTGSVGTRPSECAGMTREACAGAIATSHAWGLPAESLETPVVTCERWTGGGLGPAPGSCRSGDLLTVSVSTDFSFLTPLAGQFVGPFRVTGASSVTVQQ
jgi:hypothetical protein